ncbi:MAG: T9SS type A sorting domain-containing protein [Bacteroidetes bacterium]|nr:T9SS type A sorting domain-containing protein [Bacteroidota bacterium]MCL1968375.1 T9SS type A sorting domain-containing protein [Bacteroidota bacterium]
MKKNILLLTVIFLITSTIFAQNTETRTIASSRATAFQYDVNTVSPSRAVVYFEGFENTTGTDLPSGWTTSLAGVWITSDGDIPGVSNPQTAHSGSRFMVRSWNATGGKVWAFNQGMTLTAGVDYTITFWFRAPGYPNYGEYDDFEVRIGQTATAQGMSDATLLFSNITNRVNPWTLVEAFFVPPSTGTYYLGFHCLNPVSEGIFVMIDDIEVAECLCRPVSNFTVTYTEDCKANLKWDAPGSGNFTYQVLRDGEEIGKIETESYTDNDFEPTLEHTWSIKVICGNDLSIAKNVSKEVCLATSCSRAKKLSVTYTEGCTEALLKWNAPTEILWDNTAGAAMYGHMSVRWLMEELSRYISADDFIVPNGETWLITEVFCNGFYNDYEAPDYIGVEMFADDNGHPGEQIYEEIYNIPLEGSLNSFMTILLPEPLVISTPGKYWVSCYGVHEKEEDPNRLYYLTMCNTPNGSVYHTFDESSGTGWEPSDGEYPSLYFRVQGYKSTTPIEYNIYRDGESIATKLTEISFSDITFNPTVAHKWSVRVACPAGDQSAPIYRTEENCEEVGVAEIVDNSFTIVPNPATDKITITAKSNFSKIEVINFLGQTVITQPNSDHRASLNVSNLNSGVYFVRIVSETGTSVQKFVKR